VAYKLMTAETQLNGDPSSTVGARLVKPGAVLRLSGEPRSLLLTGWTRSCPQRASCRVNKKKKKKKKKGEASHGCATHNSQTEIQGGEEPLGLFCAFPNTGRWLLSTAQLHVRFSIDTWEASIFSPWTFHVLARLWSS